MDLGTARDFQLMRMGLPPRSFAADDDRNR
jgi:hypothetical protein